MQRTNATPGWFVWLLRTLAVIALAASFVGLVCSCLQQDFTDTFYMVASGEWVLRHGGAVQRAGLSSPMPTGFVSQNWLFCVFAALCLRASEALGLAWYGMSAVTALMALAATACAVAVARAVTGGSRVAQLATVLVFLSIPTFANFRPHALVTALTIYNLWANWRWATGGGTRTAPGHATRVALVPLLLVPPLTVLHSNVQSATVLTQPLVCLGYAAALAVVPPPGAARGRAVAPAAVGLLSTAAAFVNPYGADAVLYAVNNAGIVSGTYVLEMFSVPTALANGKPFAAALVVVLGGILALLVAAQLAERSRGGDPAGGGLGHATGAARGQVAGGDGQLGGPAGDGACLHPLETLMAAAGIAASYLAVRNLLYGALLTWWLAMVAWAPTRAYVLRVTNATSLADALRLGAGRARTAAAYLTYAAVMAVALYSATRVLALAETPFTPAQRAAGTLQAESAPVDAANLIESDYAARAGSARPRVLTLSNAGSYFEYRGCIVNCTSRFETWEPHITGVGLHLFRDTAAASIDGETDALARLLAVTNWDYVFAPREVGAYFARRGMLDGFAELGDANGGIVYRRTPA